MSMVGVQGGMKQSKVKIAQYVKVEPQPDGKQIQSCVFCGHSKNSVVFQATKWSVHVLSCPSAPEELKEQILKGSNSREIHDAARNLVEAAENRNALPPPPAGGGGAGGSAAAGNSANIGSLASPSLYDHVAVIQNGDGTTKQTQTCRYCGKSKASSMFQATKWAVHLLQCDAVPLAVKKAVLQGTRSREVQEVALQVDGLQALASSILMNKGRAPPTQGVQVVPAAIGPYQHGGYAATYASSPPPSKRMKTNPNMASASSSSPYPQQQANALSSPIPRADPCDQARADRASLEIMKFIASCALPMVTVESNHFLGLLRALNRTYVDKYLSKADAFTDTWLPALYKSLTEHSRKIWTSEKHMKRTLGLEIFPEVDTKVCVFTEAFGSHISFQKCTVETSESTDESTTTTTTTTNSSILLKQMETIAQERKVTVEDHFCAVTLVDLNLDSINEEFNAKYPKIFVNGCRSHCVETIYKALTKVDEISQVLQDARMMIDVISSHPAVQSAFIRISNGKMLERTGTQNIHKVLESLVANANHLQALVADDGWDTCANDVQNAADFVKLVSVESTFEKLRCLNRLFTPLDILTTHVERRDFRSSWIVPVFEALTKDVFDWTSDEEVAGFFSQETRDLVQLTVGDLWKLYNSDHYLMASLFDPAVFPAKDSLPSDWLASCGRVLQRFYNGRQLIDARQEMMKVVACTGMYGEEVEQRRGEVMQLELPSVASKVETVVKQQDALAAETPHLLWDTVFYREFPLLSDIAIRLLAMSTRANVVERSCNARKLAKASGRLGNKKVYMLLYCHINLRLYHGIGRGHEMDDFLEQALLDHTEEVELEPKLKIEAPESENRDAGDQPGGITV